MAEDISSVLMGISLNEILDYIKNEYEYDLTDYIDNNDSAIGAIKGVCKYLGGNRYLNKEDMKKEISDFIDYHF